MSPPIYQESAPIQEDKYGDTAEEVISPAIIKRLDQAFENTGDLIRTVIPMVSQKLAYFLETLLEKKEVPDGTHSLIEEIYAGADEYEYNIDEVKKIIVEILANQTSDREKQKQEEVEVTPTAKVVPIWWILILIVFILSAYYLIRRNAGKKNRS